MKKAYDYDLIVIGSGIAGMVSAMTAHALGKHIAVIEKAKVGGNCTNSTCIPSKALIRLSHLSRDMAHLDRLGLRAVPGGGLDSRRVMAHIRNIVQKAYEKDLPETFERIGIHMISASAEFADRHHLQANGQILSADKFVIATGTTPLIPDIPGLGSIEFLTNETLYRLDDLPKSLIILGSGVDGLEYASAFGRLGVQTTVVGTATRLLPGADSELVDHLLQALQAEGIRLLSGTRAVGLFNRQDKVALRVQQGEGTGEEIHADRLLIAVGRKPDLEGLSLEKAGVHYNSKGIITDRKLQTSAPNIYACGDIVGPYQLASTAEAQAIVAATNAVLPFKRNVDYRNNVYVIFTEPPLAYIGLTEEQARERFGHKLKVYRFDYSTMRRALIDGNEVGVAKLLCDGHGRIVGAHILGEAAPEVIHEVLVIKSLHKPLYKLNSMTHAYPTYAQALVGRASQLAFLDRMESNFFVRTALQLLPGYANRLHVARERLAEAHPFAPTAQKASVRGAAESEPGAPAEIRIKGVPGDGKACIIQSRISNQDILILDIRGHLTAACEKELSQAFEDGIEKSKSILLNFSELLHLDTEGAGLLVINTSRATRKNLGVGACGLTDPFRDVFHLTRLDEVIALFDSEKEALRSSSSLRRKSLSAGILFNYQGPLVPGWTRSVGRLLIRGIPVGAMNINVHGRQTTGPVKGFGQLWDKKYRLRIQDTSLEPQQVISIWRSEFPNFWPAGNRLFTSGEAAITPGTGAVLNLRLPGGLVLATGLMVIYADETSFSFITIQGHVISGWITFSSFRENSSTTIQVHPIFRTSDPLMELGFRFGAAKEEDQFWHRTLGNLSSRLGAQGKVEQQEVLVDPRVQWSELKNLWYSAAIRSSLYMPLYMLKRLIKSDQILP
jgi:pyruvate/2-oxoglutarate dehydrogenase complex dihydrolipoamide dehydrogenase (E3) component/anti-anti-sigma regulatory factor